MSKQEEQLSTQITWSNIVNYVGLIGAITTSIAYIVVVLVIVNGFKAKMVGPTLLFAMINGIMGLVICQLLKVQGIALAKLKLPKVTTSKPKYKSIEDYWRKSILQDILIRGLGVVLATVGIIYIAIEGSKDYSLLLLAFVNLIMFGSFGLLALSNAHDAYLEVNNGTNL